MSLVRLSTIIVSWNTRDLLERCIKSVLASIPESIQSEIIVVDNASTDGSPEMVRSRFPEVSLLVNDRNVGFAEANNQAIRKSAGEYLLLLNPDTEIVGEAIPEMLRFIDQRPDIAVLGPKLLNPDGSVQSSRRSFPTKATAFLESTVLQRLLPNHPALQRYYAMDRSDEVVQEVDWLVGACLMVRSEAVKTVGLLDEGFFMYSEELDWCRRLVDAGWKVMYLPSARVIHYGGQSSDQYLFGRHIRFQYSKCRYFEKHHGYLFGQLLRCFIFLNYLFLLGEDIVKLLLLRRKRAMRRQRISTLWQVLVWQAKWVVSWGKVRL
ncbi:MAG: glycosyltransferase family 2 protein [Chloroflexota bacterium]|jgi:N-acetylglucosaminyl-diphospho-decaprenol L-rhamnosyltransferase